MKLWVARHSFAGDFLPYDPKGERERKLKPLGIAMAKATARAMGDAGEIPNVIFASPLERAKQTADTIGAELGVQVNVIDDLAPNRPMQDRLLELMAHGDVRRMMIVGHHDNIEPAFEEIGGDFDPIAMAEVRRLKIDRKTGQWEERWRVQPRDLGFPMLGIKNR